MAPLDFLAARTQLYPDTKIIKVKSPEHEAILRLMKRSGYKTLEEIILAEMPHEAVFIDWRNPVQPINRVIPIINIPAMSQREWLQDVDNRLAFAEHLKK